MTSLEREPLTVEQGNMEVLAKDFFKININIVPKLTDELLKRNSPV